MPARFYSTTVFLLLLALAAGHPSLAQPCGLDSEETPQRHTTGLPVRLAIYDLLGRRVRTLASGAGPTRLRGTVQPRRAARRRRRSVGKLIDALPCLQVVEEEVHRNTRAAKGGGAAELAGVYLNDVGKTQAVTA